MEDFPAPTQLTIIKYLFRYNARVHYLSTEKISDTNVREFGPIGYAI